MFARKEKKEMRNTIAECNSVLKKMKDMHSEINRKCESINTWFDGIENPAVRGKSEGNTINRTDLAACNVRTWNQNGQETQGAMSKLWKYGFSAKEIAKVLDALELRGPHGNIVSSPAISDRLLEIGARKKTRSVRRHGTLLDKR